MFLNNRIMYFDIMTNAIISYVFKGVGWLMKE